MSKSPTAPIFNFLSITLIFLTHLAASETDIFSRSLSPKQVGLKRETLSHLHFYLHDIVSGKNPTAVDVARPTTMNESSTLFGLVAVMDDPLTVKPENSSKLVGRAQGIYVSASQTEVVLLMVMNFFFTEGRYNGSTLSILGRNSVFSSLREMPIIGGSGVFRFARGYALVKPQASNPKTGDAVEEYDVYVFHY